ncbi:MAG: hypothetical protein ABIE94_07110 [archaeon]
MKTTLVITEKRSVSQAIVRVLAPDSYDDHGNCSVQHCDIISIRTEKRRAQIDDESEIDCRVRMKALKRKNYFYFCQADCMGCEFEASYLDADDSKDAGRIRKKVRNVNESLLKNLRRPILEVLVSLGREGTIGDVCAALEDGAFSQLDHIDESTETLEDAVESVCARIIYELSKSRKSYNLTEDHGVYTLRGSLPEKRIPIVAEDINYFVFERNGELVIVVDTYGNPLRLKLKERWWEGAKQILGCKSWKDMEAKLYREPAIQDRDLKYLKSHKVRSFLLNSILSKRRLPCDYNGLKAGAHLDLERVIAATDFDIAGSAIFLSVIDAANSFTQRRAGKSLAFTVEPDMLWRMHLQSMDPERVAEEFDNPAPFDWQNAKAGEARDIFDFLYGSTITDQLKECKPKDLKIPNNVRFSVGRTQFLGLKKVIGREQEIASAEPQEYMYVVVPGRVGLEEIKEALAKGEFSALHVREKLSSVSLPRFLTMCEEDNIGTHTTRYKLINTLRNRKVIVTADNRAVSTPFGNFFYNYMAPILDGRSFSIEKWNQNLYGTMDAWSVQDEIPPDYRFRGREEMEREFNNFMEWFLPSLKQHLGDLEHRYKGIVRDLWEAYQKLPTFTYRKPKNPKDEAPDAEGIVIVGKDALVHTDDIKKIIDPETNIPYSEGPKGYVRIVPQKPFDIEPPLRRACCIDIENEFELVKAYQLFGAIGTGNEDYTVFRTTVEPGTDPLVALMGSDRSIDDYTECELDESNFEEEGESVGHESLHLDNVSPSDIAGPDGLLVAQEYNKPWMATIDMMRRAEAGGVNVEKFTSGAFDFKKVSRYEYGVVHNFESLLIAMMEKHGIPFWKTAKLAEELYLGGH